MENLAPERTLTRSGLFGSLACALFEQRQRLRHLVPEAVRELAAASVVLAACLGGDGEAGRDWHAGAGHLGGAGALAAKEVSHLR